MALFRDRAQAAEALILRLPPEVGKEWLVLALPRGGVPIAAAIARHLGATLDLLIVRKVGAPRNPELALAAVTGPGRTELVINERLCSMLRLAEEDVERLARPEVAEIVRRRRIWAAPGVPLTGRRVLMVDDGAATGTTLRAAIEAARRQEAQQIGVALPLALGSALSDLPDDVSPVICPYPVAGFSAVGSGYALFPQVSDDEVTDYFSRKPVAGQS